MVRALALAADSEHNRTRVASACDRAGLEVLDLSRATVDLLSRDDVALRLPIGLATWFSLQGVDVRLAAVPAAWLCDLPREVTGRDVRAVTVGELGNVDLAPVRMVKLAGAKHREFAATRVRDLDEARHVVAEAGLPPDTVLLLADGYLDCDSEYRTFTVGREVVACSPYLVEGESWSRDLPLHRASFHDDAAAFVADLLAGLPDDDVPPACVLDVVRTPSGALHLLEANTAWGAGLYGCDPDGVLQAVLAANGVSDGPWHWRPDPGFATLVAQT